MAVQNRIVKVQKRNRALVTFDVSRIGKALLRAASSIGGFRADFLPGINEKILMAISAGSVLMGALTYIGNGPNFMVKAIADQRGFKNPSFFGYMFYASITLLPVFALVTILFFK